MHTYVYRSREMCTEDFNDMRKKKNNYKKRLFFSWFLFRLKFVFYV